MKTLKNILGLGLVALTFTACSDVADEITELTLGRNLSPIDIQAKNVNETTANLQWKAVDGASSYYIEVFADDSLTFEGTPEQTLTSETNSISLSKLNFDTKYSARVQAINENETRNSKFHGVFFRTSAKQFLKNPKEEDIADRSVTLTWEAEEGYDVSTIVIGSITHQITDEEKAAGKAIVEGLTPQTSYTALLYYNGKQCGNRSFTTIMDLKGATLVHNGDDLVQIIEDAADGDVLALYGGTYDIPAGGENEGLSTSIKIDKTITINGIFPTNKPVITGRFELNGNISLTLSNLVLDGQNNASTDQLFNVKGTDTNMGTITVNNCEIKGLKVTAADGTVTYKGYNKGLFYGNVACTIESVTFEDCYIHDIETDGGDFFDIRKSTIGKVVFKNNTIYNCAANRDLIRYDDVAGATTEFLFESNTIDNVITETGTTRRLLYIRTPNGKITWKNNLVSNSKAVFTNQSKTPVPTYENNAYYNCTNANIFDDTNDAEAKLFWKGDKNGQKVDDPKYADPANGDFTIGNESVKNLKVGAAKWYK
jgi:hypothetical protein